MAYLQLTEKCQMRCAHCCFAATGNGDHMSREVYMAALQLAAEYGDYITLGGGEPTLHPEFFVYLDKAVEFHRKGLIEDAPFVITNGASKRKAMKLYNRALKEGDVHVELSQDPWHDPIDPEVVRAFRSHERESGYGRHRSSGNRIGVRTVKTIVPVGRAIQFSNALPMQPKEWSQCCCEDLLIDPRGDIWSCGCRHTKLGNVLNGFDMSTYDREYAHEGGYEPIEEETCDE